MTKWYLLCIMGALCYFLITPADVAVVVAARQIMKGLSLTNLICHVSFSALQTAALVAYSKAPNAFDATLGRKVEEKGSSSRGGRMVAQVDLVPTISLLLGGSIPFSNLGRIIPVITLCLCCSSVSAKGTNVTQVFLLCLGTFYWQ